MRFSLINHLALLIPICAPGFLAQHYRNTTMHAASAIKNAMPAPSSSLLEEEIKRKRRAGRRLQSVKASKKMIKDTKSPKKKSKKECKKASIPMIEDAMRSKKESKKASCSMPHEWTQIGNDIDGKAADVPSAWHISLSKDGSKIAIGSPFKNGIGCFRVYEHSTSNGWEQLGSDIDGETSEFLGFSISLSEDGSRLVASSPQYGNVVGRVRVYEYNASYKQWEQLGGDIDGGGEYEEFGYSVSMSSDGYKVAIGGPGNNLVRVYEYSSSHLEWQQLGSDIDGEGLGDGFGYSVSMSSDGYKVAIGGPYNDGNGDSSGHVRVYKYSTSLLEWQQVGGDIDGEAVRDASGYTVSLSSDGYTLAIGAPGNSDGTGLGHVRVYELK
jgi:hypothetical protein